MTTVHLHRALRRARRPGRLVALAAFALVALLGTACGGDGSKSNGAEPTATEATATEPTATEATESDDKPTTTSGGDTTTTTTPDAGSGSASSCESVSATDVEGVVGEAVTEAPDLGASIVTNEAVRAATDELCVFSPVAKPGTLAVLVQRSDAAEAWDYVNTILLGSQGTQAITYPEGLGDQAIANEFGGVAFSEGQNVTLVQVVVGPVEQSTDRALALAHLLAR